MQENYSWEAVCADGAKLFSGGNISQAHIVSLVPNRPMLPRHDFSGLRFQKRFCRGFVNGFGGGMKEYVHCIVSSECRIYVRSSNGSVLMTPHDYELYV